MRLLLGGLLNRRLHCDRWQGGKLLARGYNGARNREAWGAS